MRASAAFFDTQDDLIAYIAGYLLEIDIGRLALASRHPWDAVHGVRSSASVWRDVALERGYATIKHPPASWKQSCVSAATR